MLVLLWWHYLLLLTRFGVNKVFPGEKRVIVFILKNTITC